MDKAEIITPDEDVDIGHEFTGHIRCRHLTILEGGSVSGTVVAHRVDVKGALFGVADCEYFQALPPAIVRGTVFAPKYHTRDRDDREADVVALHMSTRQQIFRELPRPALPGLDEVINASIEEAVADRIVKRRPLSDEPTPRTSDAVSGSGSFDGVELSLSERLASKGLTSLIPEISVPSDPEVTATVDPPRPVQSSRMPLPSLV